MKLYTNNLKMNKSKIRIFLDLDRTFKPIRSPWYASIKKLIQYCEQKMNKIIEI